MMEGFRSVFEGKPAGKQAKTSVLTNDRPLRLVVIPNTYGFERGVIFRLTRLLLFPIFPFNQVA
jgi:hypothetical protein